MSLPPLRTLTYDRLPAERRAVIRLRLCDSGLTALGAEQALAGQVVVSTQDRAAISRLLLRFATSRTQAAGLEQFDWPGAYAQRFDGID
ncbi:MAG: hypothetical protein ABWZ80_01105 [Beijerinckiaceae bacterium]